MNTKDLNYMNQLYKSPSVRVIEIEGADIICTSPGSSTDVFGINSNRLDDDDWF